MTGGVPSVARGACAPAAPTRAALATTAGSSLAVDVSRNPLRGDDVGRAASQTDPARRFSAPARPWAWRALLAAGALLAAVLPAVAAPESAKPAAPAPAASPAAPAAPVVPATPPAPPASSDPLADAGRAYEAGNWEKAARLYREAARKGVSPAIAWFNYGNCLVQLGRRGEAVSAYRRAIEWAPRFKRARLNLAVLAEQSQDWGEAANQYRRIWELDPQDPEIPARLGELALSARDVAEAQLWFERALQADSTDRDALSGQARAYLAVDDSAGAIAALDRYRQFLPDTLARPFFFLASLYEDAGAWRKAQWAWEDGLLRDPRATTGWMRLARLHQVQRQDATAVAVLRQAVARNPASGELWFALGQASLRTDDAEQAEEAYLRALAAGHASARTGIRNLELWHRAQRHPAQAERFARLADSLAAGR